MICFRTCIFHYFLSEFVDSIDKLSPEGIGWEESQVLNFGLLPGWSNQSEAFSVFKVFQKGPSDFPRTFAGLNLSVLFEEDVLQVFIGGKFSSVLVFGFEKEVSEEPAKLGHKPIQALFVVS